MSSVLTGKSIETEVSPLSSHPSHPLEGFLAGIPEKMEEFEKQKEMALIDFTLAVEKFEDSWLDYIIQPSRERWDVVVGRGYDVAKAMVEFGDKLGMWKAGWFSTFHQVIPTDAVDALFRTIASLIPPVRPRIVTEVVAVAFVTVDTAKRHALGLLKAWADAWKAYVIKPTKASWSDVAESWHEFQEAVRTIDERFEDQREKILLATPPEKPEEEARKVRHVINGAVRKTWREGRQKDRDAWRENRGKERKEWLDGRREQREQREVRR